MKNSGQYTYLQHAWSTLNRKQFLRPFVVYQAKPFCPCPRYKDKHSVKANPKVNPNQRARNLLFIYLTFFLTSFVAYLFDFSKLYANTVFLVKMRDLSYRAQPKVDLRMRKKHFNYENGHNQANLWKWKCTFSDSLFSLLQIRNVALRSMIKNVLGSVPSKDVCRKIGPALWQTGSTGFLRMS